MSSLDELYKAVLLDHYTHPRNRGVVEGGGPAVDLRNPSCGDTIRLSLRLDEAGRIAEVRFLGQGCSISQASASIMTESVKGKPAAEALALAGRFKAMLRGEAELTPEDGDLLALEGVRQFPVRVKCATLAWNALEKAVAAAQGEAGEAGRAAPR
ncbi:MAG: SUF system NifU family Fe-S cluster assembly protein [Clostridia bacterium]|nr:SUF system NifU family Fe-S cluster assembly protein [Clostridia bacterium]MCL6520748.1 SUF system NifU family Fe-S cluster assembly protein [Bacillota bacterium]